MQKQETKSSIIGKSPGSIKMNVSQDGGDIDAISASTITSRAFLEAVNKAYAAYTQSDNYTSTGATIQVEQDTTEINE
jgi:electron transport complex protein RnfG